MPIHPTAIVDKSAEIDASAEIGAYAIIESGAVIGEESHVYPHAFVGSAARIGRAVQIHPFAVVGHHPQDVKWDGSPSFAHIGDETIIREHASIHRGSEPGSATTVAARCFIMSAAHVAHNCSVADDVVIASGAVLGGHVQVGERAFIGGNAAVHQFVRVGELVMLGGLHRAISDLPPFMTFGDDGVQAVNVIGLRRAGFTPVERDEIRACHRTLYRSGLLFQAAIDKVERSVRTEPGRRLVAFLRGPAKRGFARYTRRNRPERQEPVP